MGVSMDVFKGDAFAVTELTAAINKLPFKPTKLGSLNLFRDIPIHTTTCFIEERHGKLTIVPAKARGGPATPISERTRKGRHFECVHLPQMGEVFADDVLGVREFGQEDSLETVTSVVNDKLQQMRDNFEFTFEWQRLAAIKGVLLDHDGAELYNWFDEFGITQDTVTFDLTSPRGAKLACHEITRLIEDALGMDTYDSIIALCGKDAYDHLTCSSEVAAAYDRWKEGSYLREGQARKMFEYADIQFMEYRGKVGSEPFVGDDEIHVFPTGTRDIFLNHMAPADYVEAVNTKGKKMYVKQEPKRFNKGIDLEGQANPLHICTRPAVLISASVTPEA
jgi:hypothetical protein